MDDTAVFGLLVIALAGLITIALGLWLKYKERGKTVSEKGASKPLIIRAKMDKQLYAVSKDVAVIYTAANHTPHKKCQCCGCEHPLNAAVCDICGTLL